MKELYAYAVSVINRQTKGTSGSIEMAREVDSHEEAVRKSFTEVLDQLKPSDDGIYEVGVQAQTKTDDFRGAPLAIGAQQWFVVEIRNQQLGGLARR